MPPELPKLPKLPRLPNPIRDLREVIRGGHSIVADAQDGIRGLASDIRGLAGQEPSVVGKTTSRPAPPQQEATEGIKSGTACTLCSSEHFTQVSGDLAEAMRFARTEGLRHAEVMRRVEHARMELNEMERYDLSSAEIQKLSGADRELAEWALLHSRDLRHAINQAIMSKALPDLETAAAIAERTAQEFATKLWELPAETEECGHCPKLTDLKTYLESRRKPSSPA